MSMHGPARTARVTYSSSAMDDRVTLIPTPADANPPATAARAWRKDETIKARYEDDPPDVTTGDSVVAVVGGDSRRTTVESRKELRSGRVNIRVNWE